MNFLTNHFTETLQKKNRDIAELIFANPHITQMEMATSSDNGGHWELMFSGSPVTLDVLTNHFVISP